VEGAGGDWGGDWSKVPQKVDDAVVQAEAVRKAERDAPAKKQVARVVQALFVEAAKSKGCPESQARNMYFGLKRLIARKCANARCGQALN
jgi:hypothetical protein